MRCIVCNKNIWENYYNRLLRCKNCSLIRAKDIDFKVNEKDFYGLRYFKEIDYGNYFSEKPALIKNFKDRIQRISKYKKEGTLLEIGCAFGYFLKLAQKKYHTTGIDLNPQITKIAKSNSKKSIIITGNLLKIKIPKNSFEMVVMLDTIEHLKNPLEYIKKIKLALAPSGILVIETGDIEAFIPKIQRGKWRLIAPPSHLYYFSKKSLSLFLENNGFLIMEIVRVPFYRSLRQIIFRLAGRQLFDLPKKIMDYPIPLYTGDLMFVIAQKTN